MSQNKLTLSISPHLNSPASVSKVMLLVIITLLPALGWGVYLYGLQAILLTLTCILGAVLSEMAVQLLRKRDIWVIKDFSAILTGLLLAMVLPPSLPLIYAFLGACFAIIIGKALFGGLGFNIFNPALLGRAFLQMSFPVVMTTWIIPKGVNTVSSATPLALGKFEQIFLSAKELFFGLHGGCVGEASALFLLLGGVLLMALRVIDYRIPISIFGTVAILAVLFSFITGGKSGDILYHFCSGGLMIGAFYMATDMVTSPLSPLGNILFGIGVGSVVMVIRVFGGLPEGVMFSILFMNAFVPLINRHTRPRILGDRKQKS
ncbi:RnfABCDGE type electron transport complex subunit D [Candidatus Margulisiibacteriota bacterium]